LFLKPLRRTKNKGSVAVTPEGFPLAYEVLAGNTSDRTTLREVLKKIETQYGKPSASG
jgi:transposase